MQEKAINIISPITIPTIMSNNNDNIPIVDSKIPPHSPRQVLILGSGFAGVQVLKRLQNRFKNDEDVDIILVSRDNFLLFTPMLPEVASE